jgi:hypothetical protein
MAPVSHHFANQCKSRIVGSGLAIKHEFYGVFLFPPLLISFFQDLSAPMIPQFMRLNFQFGIQPFWELSPGGKVTGTRPLKFSVGQCNMINNK